jgi:hypothetical protein
MKWWSRVDAFQFFLQEPKCTIKSPRTQREYLLEVPLPRRVMPNQD